MWVERSEEGEIGKKGRELLFEPLDLGGTWESISQNGKVLD